MGALYEYASGLYGFCRTDNGSLEHWDWVCLKSLVMYFLASQILCFRYPKVSFNAYIALIYGQLDCM